MKKNIFYKAKKLSLIVLIAIIATFAASCGREDSSPGIAISPVNAVVNKGENLELFAKITGSDAKDKTIVWSILEDDKSGKTIIDENGKLFVSADETLTLLTVKAVLKADSSFYGTKMVVVFDRSMPALTGKTVSAYFNEEGIKLGWNLGNTMDAYTRGTPVASETAINNPKATQILINGVKREGFDIIRIPVTWMGHIGPAPNYKISEARLNRVNEVVDYAKNAGLKAIINIHHDDSNEVGWFLIKKAVEDKRDHGEITAKFAKIWMQVAEHFKDYGEWLIFESMNEVQDGGWGWSNEFKAKPKPQMDIINEWNQLFTDIVRATGGGNINRYLMYPSYSSNFETLLPDGKLGSPVGKYFTLPQDKTGPGRQLVTFHYYEPFDFAHNAATKKWGTDAEKEDVDRLFARFKSVYIDNNIPVVIGEMGPRVMGNSNSEEGRASRLAYISYVWKKARENGLVPIYWDDGGSFGMMGRNSGMPSSQHSEDSFRAMMEAVKQP